MSRWTALSVIFPIERLVSISPLIQASKQHLHLRSQIILPPSNNNSLTLNCWSSIDLNLSNGNNLNGTEAEQGKTQSEPDLCPKPTCRETRPCSDQEWPCREGCRSQICPFFQIAKLPICRIISNSGNFLNSNLPRHSLTLETSVSTIGPSST